MTSATDSSLWRHREFRLYWTGQASDVLGSSLSSVAIPLVAVVTLHATTWEAAILAAVQKTPPLLFSLPAGAWCDRVRKRPLMVATSLVCAAVTGSVPLAAAEHRRSEAWGAHTYPRQDSWRTATTSAQSAVKPVWSHNCSFDDLADLAAAERATHAILSCRSHTRL
ncbi:MFS transporter [Streptomyces sp. NBC_00056]|uniref:MFS transporter n=1 Tax=Streptomyces sp. NBC_00056 TaxID=2975633 RepID=UPI00325256E7